MSVCHSGNRQVGKSESRKLGLWTSVRVGPFTNKVPLVPRSSAGLPEVLEPLDGLEELAWLELRGDSRLGLAPHPRLPTPKRNGGWLMRVDGA